MSHELNETRANEKQERESNVRSNKLACLYLIVISLTIYNICSLISLWKSLNNITSLEFDADLKHANGWPKIDLLSSSESVIFSGRLIGRHKIEAKEIRRLKKNNNNDNELNRLFKRELFKKNFHQSKLKILSKNPLEFKLVQAINGTDIEITSLIQFIPSIDQIKFPKYIKVLNPNKSDNEPLMICNELFKNNENNKTCHFNKVKKVSFTNIKGLELSKRTKRSIETRLIDTNRLHSATNKLILRSSKVISLKSDFGPVHLRALGDVIISSMKSGLIINATTIDIKGLDMFNRGQSKLRLNNTYKLCICKARPTDKIKLNNLRNIRARSSIYRTTALDDDDDDDDLKKEEIHYATNVKSNGLLFAIRFQYECSKFVKFCQKQQQQQALH